MPYPPPHPNHQGIGTNRLLICTWYPRNQPVCPNGTRGRRGRDQRRFRHRNQAFMKFYYPPKFLTRPRQAPCTTPLRPPVPPPPLSCFVLDYLRYRAPTCTPKSASLPFRASPTQSRPILPMPLLRLPMPLLRLPVPRLLVPRVLRLLRLWRSIPPTTAPVHLPVPRLPVLWCMATTLLPMPVPRRPVLVSRLRRPRSSPPSPELEGAATAPRRGAGSLFGRSMPWPCRQLD